MSLHCNCDLPHSWQYICARHGASAHASQTHRTILTGVMICSSIARAAGHRYMYIQTPSDNTAELDALHSAIMASPRLHCMYVVGGGGGSEQLGVTVVVMLLGFHCT